MQATTVSPEYVKSALRGAIIAGYDPEEILKAQGLPPQMLSNPRLRISTSAFAGLSQALIELLKDETWGLLAKPTPRGTFSLMAKASLSCENVLESLKTWRDLTNWLNTSSSSHMLFNKNGGYIAFKCKKANGVHDNYVIECLISSCHRFHCWLANEFLPIERVDLAFEAPSYSDEHRFVFYGAPIHYGQKKNAIYFSRKTLEQTNLRARDELSELVDQHLSYILNQTRHSNTASISVRLWMEKLFREGTGLPLLEDAAKHLGLTEQTLRRRIKKEGNTFMQIKDDTRRDVAMYYIKQSQLSIEEIALRLGFSEASSFIKSFKRWANVTPLVYRNL
ncbi:putative HTH-type transcriptional regulator [Zhongshania aliphaticivorans]|uniref:Putative HTH-type transcriptional regulator n=1 Tax=Zhongshania aliphaticivorans TaxID=1470434 RepID=A0A5S9N4J7_9GAMM|nr:AraC family transcriptional regulator [Zhongshania aliphaticivorans]CAA0081712.1 putative HTH-type transcriptional regulator [Zhongshania aliphaticivorans]CAA0084702.1 putative HTH-type transcriptional regulator [Zhongshania aliphaticivorans]